MPDLSLPDVTLHYEVDGSGPPLLLLAGMLSDGASWQGILPLLTPYFTVIRPDNRLAGRTLPMDTPATVQDCAADALALMDHLGHAAFHLAGHSMGGLMAMELAGMAGTRISSLCILASAPVRAPRTSAIFDTLLRIRRAPEGETLWLEALYPWMFRADFFANPANATAALEAALAYPHAQSVDAMARQIEVLRGYRPAVRAGDIATRTLILHAGDDILIPREAAQAAFARMPNAEQITVPDAGHSICWDAPQATAAEMIRFAGA